MIAPARVAARRSRVALAAALLGLGCVPLPGGRTLERKTVAAKVGEATLVADDGTRCTVSPGRFEHTRIGDGRTCAWESGDRTNADRPSDRPATAPRRPTMPSVRRP